MGALARELERLGHRVTVLTYREGGGERAGGERVVALPTIPLGGLRGPSFILEASSWLRLRGWRFDVVHAHYARTSGAAAWISARLGGPRFVLTFHGTDAALEGRIDRAATCAVARGASAVTAVSRFLSSRVRERCGVEPTIIPGAVDREVFGSLPEREECRRIVGIPEDSRVVAFVGSLVEVRDPLTAVRAVSMVEGVAMLIVGDGPLRGEVERLAAELGMGGRLLAVGRVPRAEVPLYLRAADVSIHTPRFEGQGLAILESMAAGTPPVAVDVGAIGEVVEDGVTGLLTGRDPRELASAVERLLGDEDLRLAMAREGMRRAMGRSWSDVVGEYLRLYGGTAD